MQTKFFSFPLIPEKRKSYVERQGAAMKGGIHIAYYESTWKNVELHRYKGVDRAKPKKLL